MLNSLAFLILGRDLLIINFCLLSIFLSIYVILSNRRDFFKIFLATELLFANMIVLCIIWSSLTGILYFIMIAYFLVVLSVVEAAVVLSLIVGVYYYYKNIRINNSFFFGS